MAGRADRRDQDGEQTIDGGPEERADSVTAAVSSRRG